MALARARALRTLQSTFRPRAVPRVSAPGRTQLVQRRYASGSGDGGHGESSSDLPWLLGGIAVTIPSCWYLWPESHGDHHGGHGEHEEHEEAEEKNQEGEEGGEESKEGGEESGEGAGEDAPQEEDSKGDEGAKDEGKEDESAQSDEKFEQKEQDKQDEEPTKDKEGDSEDSQPPRGEDKEQETKPGGGGGKDDETKVEQVANERKLKKKPGYGQELGEGHSFEENPQGGPKKEAPVTAKEAEKGKYGEITGKQFGLSTGPTKHSLPIDSDPNKSKKGEGTPETAKAMGTVDPNRPAK